MFDILLENHLRKRTRIAKDASFKHDIYDVHPDAFGEVESIEQYIDKLAEAYDPTYNAANQSTGSVYLEYIIDNLKRNKIQFNEQSQIATRRILQHYHEDQSAPKPALDRDFQRHYRDIIPTLQEALTQASIIKKDAVLASPEFAIYYEANNSGAFGGLTKVQFYDTLSNLFDPSEDNRYMAYVLRNLMPTKKASGEIRPPNISKEESAFVKNLLAIHMQQVEAGNTKIKRDVQRFYPNIKFDLVNAVARYMPDYNTTDKTSETFDQTTQFFDERIGKPTYKNKTHAFYYLQNAKEAKKVIRNLQDPDFAEVSKHCTGYWCLTRMEDYFPAWISVDVYGFVDYAIVPKPQSAYAIGEIKNRFNNQPQGYSTMTLAEQESILDFMLNSEYSSQLTKPFKTLENSYNGIVHQDYGQFLMQCKDLQTINRLTEKNFATVDEFIKWVFGVTATTATSIQQFNNRVLPSFDFFQKMFNGREGNFPLFQQFKGKARGDTSGTALDHSELVKTVFVDWVNNLQSFVNKFVKDKNASLLDAANLKVFKNYFASADTQTIMQLFRAKYNKVCDALAHKVEDETLRFEGAASYQNIVDFNTMLMNNKRIVGDALHDALAKSFATYLRTGGLQTMTTDKVNAAEYSDLHNIAKIAGSNASDKAKINTIKIYMSMLQDATTASDRNYARASSLITGITSSMKSTAQLFKMNEQDIARAVAKAINSYIQQEQQQNKKVNDDIIMRMYKSFERNYETKIKAYNAEAPLFIQAVATIDAKSKAHALYPQLFAVQTTSLAPVARIKLAQKFASLGSIQYNYTSNTEISNMQGEMVNAGFARFDQNVMYIRSSNWNALATFIKLATSDKRQRAQPSLSMMDFYAMKDAINNLVMNYQATLVDVKIGAFYNQPTSATSFVQRYRDADARIANIEFFIRMKLNAENVKDKIVGVTRLGVIVNALGLAGASRSESYDNFNARMQRMNAPANESRSLKFKKFNLLFERASLFDKCKSENK